MTAGIEANVAKLSGPTASTARAEARSGTLQLVVIDDVFVRRFPLPLHGRVVIGRSSEADIQIDHPAVSRRHLQLSLGWRIILHDLGSRNGVEVAGRRLQADEAVALKEERPFSIGPLTLILQRALDGVDVAQASTIAVDRRSHMIVRGNSQISLAKRPVLRRLFYALAAHAGTPCTKVALVREVWEAEYRRNRHDNMLRVTIHQLRAVLEQVQIEIELAPSGGYRIVVPATVTLTFT